MVNREMTEPQLSVPFDKLVDIERRDGCVMWWCGMPDACCGSAVPADSEFEAHVAAVEHLARVHSIQLANQNLYPTRWYRVVNSANEIWCETSDEEEARAALGTCPGGGTLFRRFEWRHDQWIEWPVEESEKATND